MKSNQVLKQKCLGIILLCVGILAMVMLPEDATGGLFVSFMALCLILGKTYDEV